MIYDSNILFLPFSGLAGLLAGSLMNVVVWRLPLIMARKTIETPSSGTKRFDLWYPASHCPSCSGPIAYKDNIPIFSWLLLASKCRHCQTPIPFNYPAIETTCSLAFVLIAWYLPSGFVAVGTMIYFWFACALSIIDYRTMLLPDSLTLLLLWSGLLYRCLINQPTIEDGIYGTVFGYLSLWLIHKIFKLVTGEDGIGHGDFKLFAAVGAWNGWQSLPLVAVLASLAGLVAALYIITIKKQKIRELPFGPCLSMAGWGTFVWSL